MTIAQCGTIEADHLVREEFSNRTSGSNDYYESKDHAICAFGCALAEYGLCFDPDDLIEMLYNDGCIRVDIYTRELECSKRVGRAALSWCRMDSDQWEVVGYII